MNLAAGAASYQGDPELLLPEQMIGRVLDGNQRAQRRACDPDFNPRAAAFFIFSFCMTQDEEQGGVTVELPDPNGRGAFCLDFVEWLDRIRVERLNGEDRKSRRKLHTWLFCFYDLWAVQWVPGYSCLMLSKSEDHVDDGGKNKISTFSIFGRIRHGYTHLPAHVSRPCNSTTMSFECPENQGWIVGKAPSIDAGRGGGFTTVRADECAFIALMNQIHTAIDPACKTGKTYISTVNGPDNLFAQLWKDTPKGWIKFDCNWWDDPACRDYRGEDQVLIDGKPFGMRETVEGPERDRFGQYWSPWFETATSALSDETIAQEYLKRFEKSTTGQIWRAFAPEIHVPGIKYLLDPRLDVYVGLDYGSTGVSAGVVGQLVKPLLLRGLIDYEWENLGGAPEHAANLWALLRDDLRYQGDIGRIICVGGPDTDITTGGGQTIGGYFRHFGFTQVRQCRLRGPGSVDRRIEVVRVALRNVWVILSSACKTLPERIPGYRFPVNRITGAIGKVPALGKSNHICDGFGYLCCETLPIQNSRWGVTAINTPIPGAPHARVHDPDLAAVLPRPFEREGLGAIDGGSAPGTVWDLHRKDIA